MISFVARMLLTVISIKRDLGNLKLLIFNCHMSIQCNNDSYVSSISGIKFSSVNSVYGFIIDQINRHDSFVPCIIGNFNFKCAKDLIGFDLFCMFTSELNLICDDMLDGSVSYTYRHNFCSLRR